MSTVLNNPFLRFKHYVPNAIDPQENHATECLAACLVFSARMRNAFLQFFLNTKSKEFDCSTIEVTTQERLAEGGYFDLVLRQTAKLIIVIEVKVKSPEDCEHHRRQLKNYRKWLREQPESNAYLFTLVRNEDAAFCPQDYGADGRRTWAALYKCFQSLLAESELDDSERSLAENFCGYLESEAIVSTYEIKDLLSYAGGIKAQMALTGIFNQVASRLEAQPNGFSVISYGEGRTNYWPQLRIKHPRWDQVFGTGDNRKIGLWFCVPGIWDETEHGFWSEIELWAEDHGNDWQRVQSRLSRWLRTLKENKYHWKIFQTWSKTREDVPAQEIQTKPKKITAWRDADHVILSSDQLQTEDALIDLLTDQVRHHSTVVASLHPAIAHIST